MLMVLESAILDITSENFKKYDTKLKLWIRKEGEHFNWITSQLR